MQKSRPHKNQLVESFLSDRNKIKQNLRMENSPLSPGDLFEWNKAYQFV